MRDRCVDHLRCDKHTSDDEDSAVTESIYHPHVWPYQSTVSRQSEPDEGLTPEMRDPLGLLDNDVLAIRVLVEELDEPRRCRDGGGIEPAEPHHTEVVKRFRLIDAASDQPKRSQ